MRVRVDDKALVCSSIESLIYLLRMLLSYLSELLSASSFAHIYAVLGRWPRARAKHRFFSHQMPSSLALFLDTNRPSSSVASASSLVCSFTRPSFFVVAPKIAGWGTS